MTSNQQQLVKFILLCFLSVIGLIAYVLKGGTLLKALIILVFFSIIAKVAKLAYHRWLSHRLLEPGKFGTWFMLWCCVSSGLVKPLNYVIGHRLHHKYSDTDKDPHNTKLGFWNFLIGNFNVPEKIDVPLGDMFKNKTVMFVHKHYYKLVLLNILLFALVDIDIVLLSFSLLNLRIWVNVAIFNYWAHGGKHGQGPINMPAWTGWLMGYVGEQLHKNHHDNPSDANFGKTSPFNFDVMFFIAKRLTKVRQ